MFHRYNVPKVWENVVDQIQKAGNDVARLNKLADTPFLSDLHRSAISQILKKATEDPSDIPGLKRGELFALTARGTGGSTVAAINRRAAAVGRIFTGDPVAIYRIALSPNVAFRTVADLYKTPLDKASDLDLNFAVKGGGLDRLKELQGTKRRVSFGNGRLSPDELEFPDVVDGFVKTIRKELKGKELAEMEKFLTDPNINPPIEIYYYDNLEFAQWASKRNVRDPLNKGGITFFLDGNDVQLVTNRSLFFDPRPTSEVLYDAATFGRLAASSTQSSEPLGYLHGSPASALTSGVSISEHAINDLLEFALEQWASWIEIPNLDIEVSFCRSRG